jgi:hypothetical protein
MASHFKSGTVIFRQWDSRDGLNEVARTFSSLDELFNLCLQTDETLLVDRIIMEGQDSKGGARTVTLVFQSATVPDDAGE